MALLHIGGRRATAEELATQEARIVAWLARQREDNPVVAGVDRDPSGRRWYLRMHGEERDYIAIWLTLGEYTLQYEIYFMPAPQQQVEALYDFLLRCNRRMYGMGFAIGAEEAIYLVGHTPLAALDDHELDRIIGSAYAYVEQWLRTAMSIGFGAKRPR